MIYIFMNVGIHMGIITKYHLLLNLFLRSRINLYVRVF